MDEGTGEQSENNVFTGLNAKHNNVFTGMMNEGSCDFPSPNAETSLPRLNESPMLKPLSLAFNHAAMPTNDRPRNKRRDNGRKRPITSYTDGGKADGPTAIPTLARKRFDFARFQADVSAFASTSSPSPPHKAVRGNAQTEAPARFAQALSLSWSASATEADSKEHSPAVRLSDGAKSVNCSFRD
jgi:hypothetical protein